MFRLTHSTIPVAEHAAALADPHSGGFVEFRGCVRDHHQGRAVDRLHYDVYESLAKDEGQRIVEEALERFAVDAVSCIHRVGDLEVGDVAVWVGVGAAHRDAAFAACRYVIDEIKSRVPIWKHEFYVDGSSEWVGCQGCEQHGDPTDRYARQTALLGVGAAGQRRLRDAHVLIVGLGALGCPVSDALTAAGVGRLTLVDGDQVELSNLHRQALYVEADAGSQKVEAARRRLEARNHHVQIKTVSTPVDEASIRAQLIGADLVIECTDSTAAKRSVTCAAREAGVPWIVGGIHRFAGGVYVSPDHAPDGVCWDCISGLSAGCGDAGVLGPTPMLVGAAMAGEALRMLLGLESPLRGCWTVVDLGGGQLARFVPTRRAGCECVLDEAAVPTVSDLAPDMLWLDLRNTQERQARPLPGARVTSPSDLETTDALHADQQYLLICSRGQRSHAATRALIRRGMRNVWSLSGGLEALELKHRETA